jgi:hypothetical protein
VDSFRSATGSFQQDAPAVTDRFQTNWHPGSSFGNYDLVQYQTGRKVLPPTFTMRVRGTEFHLYGTRTSSSGKAVVYVDGKRAATVNLYARSTRYQSLLYHPTGLKDSEHVVRVQPAGTRSGRHSTVGIDYLWTP